MKERDLVLLEVPESPPRLADPYLRRLAALVSGSVSCVADPRGEVKEAAAEKELDRLVEAGFLRIIDRHRIEDAGTVAAQNKHAPSEEVANEFQSLMATFGDIRIAGGSQDRSRPPSIVMPGHDFVSDSRWFPQELFTFDRSFSPARIGAAIQAGGPEQIVSLMAEAMYERTAAHLATLQVLAVEEDAHLVSSAKVAPLFRAVESAHLRETQPPEYLSSGVELLATAVLRHAGAIDNLAALPIEEVLELAQRCKVPRREFQARLLAYADDVVASEQPEVAAEKLMKKQLAPELLEYDEKFGSVFRTIKSYAKDALSTPSALTILPLAAIGALSGLNTAWSLTVSGAYSAYKTTSARKAWPRLLLELTGRRSLAGE